MVTHPFGVFILSIMLYSMYSDLYKSCVPQLRLPALYCIWYPELFSSSHVSGRNLISLVFIFHRRNNIDNTSIFLVR